MKNTRGFVLDSWPLLAFLQDEPCGVDVEAMFKEALKHERRLLICVVNWGEVFYTLHRRLGPSKMEEILMSIMELPLEIVGVDAADLTLTRQAGLFKSRHSMSYADCFAAALAKVKGAVLVTGDREFKAVEGEVRIHWLKAA
ncbi:MAG: type II toxin-antitoxin system VapC family toxin [Planctomycetota bacterium]